MTEQGSFRLFSHRGVKSGGGHSDRNRRTNEWCCLTPFTYFLVWPNELQFVLWSKSHVKRILLWVAPCSDFVILTLILTICSVIKVTWQMNTRICLSSDILSFRRKDSEFVVWSELHDRWLVVFASFQLCSHFNTKIRSSDCDPNHMKNE